MKSLSPEASSTRPAAVSEGRDCADLDRELDAVMADPLYAGRAGHAGRGERGAGGAGGGGERSHGGARLDDQATRLRALMSAGAASDAAMVDAESAVAGESENAQEIAEPESGIGGGAFGQERPRWVEPRVSASSAAGAGPFERVRGGRPDSVIFGPSFVGLATGARIITVCSGKGGVGKTNIAVNLAVALAQNGLDVVLVDADLGTANADVLCGLMPSARLDHVVTPLPVHDAGRRTLLDIAVTAPGGFRLIPGSAGVARMADLPMAQQRQLLEDLCGLERSTQVLIIDTSAGVGRDVLDFVRIADEALIVTTPEPTAIADAYAVVKCLLRRDETEHALAGGSMSSSGATGVHDPGSSLRVLVNQAHDAAEARHVHARLSSVAERFLGAHLELAGWIAQDLRVGEAVRARLPFVLHAPKARATHDLRVIAEEITQSVVGVTKGRIRAGAARPSLLARWLRRRG